MSALNIAVSKQTNTYARADSYTGTMPADSSAYQLNGYGLTLGGVEIFSLDSDAAVIDYVNSTNSNLAKNVQVTWREQQIVSTQLYSTSTGHYLYTYEQALALIAASGVSSVANPYVFTQTPSYKLTTTINTLTATPVSIREADGTGYDIAGSNAQTLYNLASLPSTLALNVSNNQATISSINGGDSDNDIRIYSNFGVVHGGAGNDRISADSSGFSIGYQGGLVGQTLLDGGLGDDVIVGDDYNNDDIIGGRGDDMLRGEGGADRYLFLAGDSGNDLVYDVGYGGSLYEDTVVFGEGITLSDLSFSWGEAILPGYSYGSYDESHVRRFQTLDIRWQSNAVARVVMSTPFKNNYGQITERNDWEQTGVEFFEFADGNRMSMDQLLALSDVPLRPAVDRFSTIQLGTADTDILIGQANLDDLYGGFGDDTLSGGDGDDWLFGGAGNDLLAGGSGNDRYYFEVEDSCSDVLYDIGYGGSDSGYGGSNTGYGGSDMSYGGYGGEDFGDTVVFGEGINLSDFKFSWGSEHFSPFNDGNVTLFQTLNIGWKTDSVIKLVMPRPDAYSWFNTGVEFFEFADGSQLIMDQILALADPSPQHAPILNNPLADQHVFTGVAFSYTVPKDAFIDPDAGDVLTYSYSSAYWLSFDPQTRTFTGLPGAGMLGSYTISVTATDRFGASVNDSFSLTVSPATVGTAGDDVLQGTVGDDVMIGGAGNDLLNGGAGQDTYVINANDGRDSIVDAVGDNNAIRFGPGITQNDITLRLGSLMLDLGNGNAVHIEGFNPDDVFNSSSINTFRFSDGSVLSLEQLLARGFDLAGTTSDDVITGTNSSDRIYGMDGNDALKGGAGDDFLSGDSHDDTPKVRLIEQLVINAKASLLYDGVPARMDVYVDGELKASFDVLNTNHYADYSLDPGLLGLGHRIDIAFANDGYVASNPVQDRNLFIDHIKVNGQAIAATANGVQYDLGSGSAALDGKNLITGRVAMAWNGALRFSLEGNDLLDGGLGADTMSGGLGNDVYWVDNIADTIYESIDGGFDTIRSQITFDLSTTANVENLTLGGAAAISGTGNHLDNTLIGNTGNNRLDGGLGADRMEGGLGDDEYVVDNSGDVVSEAVNAGVDSVEASTSYTLTANLENLILTEWSSIDGSGNVLANSLTGNEAGNRLYGKEGNDMLIGNDGDDALYGGEGDDILYGARMNEILSSTPLNQLVISAKASLLNDGVAAQMRVYVDGLFKTSFAVSNTAAFADYSVDPALLGIGAHNVDVVYANDGYIAGNPVQDRNLYVDSIRVNGRSLAANSFGVQYDLGNGNAALDGENLIAGRVVMAWNGALRFGMHGNDLLDGGTGSDTLIGGQGNDTYVFGRGYGIDTVIENDATHGNTDTAQFLSDISIDQIWFQHIGNNLQVDILGTGDKLVVHDWYVGTANHIEQFKTSDGLTLLDSQVENLVNAMAGFAPPSAGLTSLPPDYQTTLAPVLAANWQ